ncbi:hypothetical protein M9H77_13743 [Catharanthus roseus]|uniref:Uncharacterized protein n=1 Tax=Catharanthus roseus TaxID=4058 RepID=A0ACC0BLA1_CATRO|nr:hypothetical protein M9H77_13743 [Catharanthus roseus]
MCRSCWWISVVLFYFIFAYGFQQIGAFILNQGKNPMKVSKALRMIISAPLCLGYINLQYSEHFRRILKLRWIFNITRGGNDPMAVNGAVQLSIRHRPRMAHMEEMLEVKSVRNFIFKQCQNFSDNSAKLGSRPSKQRTTCNISYGFLFIVKGRENRPPGNNKITFEVIEYYKRVVTEPLAGENDVDLNAFVSELVNNDEETLFGLLLAADYFNINGLLSVTCEDVLDMIKHKDPEHIRRIFNITLDFSLEEEENMRKENPWAFN